MKKHQLIPLIIALSLAFACSSNSGSDPEIDLEGYVTFFNLSQDTESIAVSVSGEQMTSIGFRENSDYFKVEQGVVLIEMTSANSVIYSKEVEFEAEAFYTGLIYKDNAGEYQFQLTNDYDLEHRTERRLGGINSHPLTKLNIHHLSRNIPDKIDVYDLDLRSRRLAFMKTHGIEFGGVREEYMETWLTGFIRENNIPMYAVWDSTKPQFSSEDYRQWIPSGSADPPYNSHLPKWVPEPIGEGELFYEGFSREIQRDLNVDLGQRGQNFMLVLFDNSSKDDGKDYIFRNLNTIAIDGQ